MAALLTAGSSLAEALSSAVQPKLVEMGWSSDGEDSSPLAEYVVLMLVNGKTQDQISSELSGDLLGLGPEDESTKSFTAWLFDEMERLRMAESGQTYGQGHDDAMGMGDEEMGDVVSSEVVVEGIPTGPKAMRQGPGASAAAAAAGRGRGQRPGGIFQQVNKAMDRTNDPLRRVQPRGDSARVMKPTPSGPRAQPGPNGQYNNNMNGHGPRGNHHNNNNGVGRGFQQAFGGPPQMGAGPGFNPMMMSPEQQMQFFQMMEQSAKMMGLPGPFTPAPGHQQYVGGGGGGGGGGGVGRGGYNNNNNNAGRSMFDRVDTSTARNGNGNGNHRTQEPRLTVGGRTNADESTSTNGESMDTSGIQESCKFGLGCTKADCTFAHPSPASDPSRPVTFSSGEKCQYGVNCKNRKCTSSHPSPASAPHAAQGQLECRYWPNCTNAACPFKHPAAAAASTTMPACRFGAACTRPNCHFTHTAPVPLDIPCRFTPCLNPACVYKHVEGQQEGVFDNKVWTPNGGARGGKPHVSERKFTADEGLEEELILPGRVTVGGGGGDTEMDGETGGGGGGGTEVTVGN